MKSPFDNNLFNQKKYGGFSLIEALAALIILTMIGSGALVIINRSMESTANLMLRKQAFEVARENMEMLLSLDSVSEKTESGYSEKYPDIEWTSTIEAFYEPVKSKAWLQAVCTAKYIDTEGETQTVELTHWLTHLTDQQLEQILAGRNLMKALLNDKNEIDEAVSRKELEDFIKQFMPNLNENTIE